MSGEEVYRQYQQQVRKEHPPEGTIDSLRTVVSTIREYAIPELPANEKGQIPFMRAIFESVIEEIEASIRRQETDRETAAANERNIAAIPALCRGEEVTCALHVSQPIRELVDELKRLRGSGNQTLSIDELTERFYVVRKQRNQLIAAIQKIGRWTNGPEVSGECLHNIERIIEEVRKDVLEVKD